jgi:hypothetical protein
LKHNHSAQTVHTHIAAAVPPAVLKPALQALPDAMASTPPLAAATTTILQKNLEKVMQPASLPPRGSGGIPFHTFHGSPSTPDPPPKQNENEKTTHPNEVQVKGSPTTPPPLSSKGEYSYQDRHEELRPLQTQPLTQLQAKPKRSRQPTNYFVHEQQQQGTTRKRPRKIQKKTSRKKGSEGDDTSMVQDALVTLNSFFLKALELMRKIEDAMLLRNHNTMSDIAEIRDLITPNLSTIKRKVNELSYSSQYDFTQDVDAMHSNVEQVFGTNHTLSLCSNNMAAAARKHLISIQLKVTLVESQIKSEAKKGTLANIGNESMLAPNVNRRRISQ